MRDQILAEIKKFAKANGGQPLGVRAFERQTGIGVAAWRGKYWARWGDALIEAGFAPNEFQEKHDTDFVLQCFADTCRHFSRIPTLDELKIFRRTRPDFPNPKSMYSHFGTKGALIDNLRDWIKGKDGFDDIAAIVGTSEEQPGGRATREGLVYLIKSGAHYKVGRSDELERRVKEIRIALPEAATLIHSIRTDDPAV